MSFWSSAFRSCLTRPGSNSMVVSAQVLPTAKRWRRPSPLSSRTRRVSSGFRLRISVLPSVESSSVKRVIETPEGHCTLQDRVEANEESMQAKSPADAVAWVCNPCVAVLRNFRSVLRANQRERSVVLLDQKDRHALVCLAGVPANSAEYRGHGFQTHATKMQAPKATRRHWLQTATAVLSAWLA